MDVADIQIQTLHLLTLTCVPQGYLQVHIINFLNVCRALLPVGCAILKVVIILFICCTSNSNMGLEVTFNYRFFFNTINKIFERKSFCNKYLQNASYSNPKPVQILFHNTL